MIDGTYSNPSDTRPYIYEKFPINNRSALISSNREAKRAEYIYLREK